MSPVSNKKAEEFAIHEGQVRPVTKRGRSRIAQKFDEWLGFARTYLIAYGVPGKQRRLTNLYRLFIEDGMLCFDIGSHFGNRIPVWRKLGARVVAIEPQPALYSFLRAKYATDKKVELIQAVLSDVEGEIPFYHNTKNPSLSTIDPSWITEKQRDPMWGKYVWDQELRVRALTLDKLIASHGIPDFCKIDVEGAELMVLAGLSQPLRALSFEYLTIDKERALRCIDRLEELAVYEYNWTYAEASKLKSEAWLNAADMKHKILAMDEGTYSGDIYARRLPPIR